MPARLLLVDDEPDNLDLLEAMLDRIPHQAWRAASVAGAIGLAERHGCEIDAVLLDRRLPDGSGIELAARLRSLPGLAQLPIVFQSAACAPAQVEEGIAAGADWYLIKPYGRADIEPVVRAAIAASRACRGVAPEAVSLPFDSVFSTRGEARRLAAQMAAHARDPAVAYAGLVELLLNAVEHGVHGVGYAAKHAHMCSGEWEARIAALEARDAIPARLSARRAGGRIEIDVSDPGPGFDPAEAFAPSPTWHRAPTGRGLWRARRALGELAFSEGGCRVTIMLEAP